MQKFLLSLLFLAALSCTTPPQTPPPEIPVETPAPDPLLEQFPELDEPLPWDSNVRKGVLENGMTWYVEPRSEPQGRVEMWIALRIGSLYEADDQLGLAHVVEHMAFNGTTNFARNDLVTYLEGVGVKFGPHLNAHTSFAETVYKLQLPTDDPAVVERGFVVLADWAQGITFDSDEIERERGVVLEEWRRSRGVRGRTRDALVPVIFHGSRHAERLPIGTEESLRGFDHDALRRFYKDWYRPELMAVFVVGDIKPDEAQARIEATFGGLQNREGAPVREEYLPEIFDGTVVGIYADPEQTSTSVSLNARSRGHKSQTHREYREGMVARLVVAVLNERLGDVTKASPHLLRAGASRRNSDGATVNETVWVATPEGTAEVGFALALTEVERLRRHGVTQAELDRARKRQLTHLEEAWAARDKETSRGALGELLRNFTTNETVPGIDAEWAMAQRYMPSIGTEEANTFAAGFLPNKARSLTMTMPAKEGLAVPADADLLAVVTHVEASEVPPLESDEVVGDLLASAPTAGSVVKKEFIVDPGFYRWTLSNGLVVLVKPTDFEADNVVFEAFEPGGHSLASEEDLIAAQTAVALARESGLGPFTSRQMTKWLAGRSVTVRPFVFERYSGVVGSARGEDLEVAMQMAHAFYTSPRFDQDAFDREQLRRMEVARDRDARPMTAFADTFDRLLWNDHPRRQPWTAERLAGMDLARSEAFYRARFADAAGTTFVFTGTIDLEVLEPLVSTYIASLPAQKAEASVDVGVRPAKGVLKETVRGGLDQKASVKIRYTGTFKSAPEARYALRAVQLLLKVKMREELREARGGTYGVRVSSVSRFDPVQDYGFYISFQCDPTRVDELVKAADDIVAAARKKAPTQDYADRIREQERRSWETQLRRNGYWKGALVSNAQRGEEPGALNRYWSSWKEITPKYLHDNAKKYLNPKRRVQVVLLPKAGE